MSAASPTVENERLGAGSLHGLRRPVLRSPATRGTRRPAWVDKTGIDSCHAVWFQLHEDLIATLNLERA